MRCDVALSESSKARRVVGGAGGEKRRLEFVHLTKTGGTAIEKAAISVGVRWSLCHFSRISVCNSPYTGMQDVQHKETANLGVMNTSPWHTPPWAFASHAAYFTKNPYEGADLFTVVRNPYTRVVSEYYCPWAGLGKDDPDVMNQWIRQKLQGQSHQKLHEQLERFRVSGTGGGFFIGTKHMIPQYEYVFAPGGDRLIPEENVLRFENIAEDFRELMERYDLGEWVQLSEEKTNAGKRGAQLSHLDLYPDTVRMINSFFERDFEAFGYERVEAFRTVNATNNTVISKPAVSKTPTKKKVLTAPIGGLENRSAANVTALSRKDKDR
ncbi:hypothetical protein ACHAXT_012464 [Thalassiosira profunda]